MGTKENRRVCSDTTAEECFIQEKWLEAAFALDFTLWRNHIKISITVMSIWSG